MRDHPSALRTAADGGKDVDELCQCVKKLSTTYSGTSRSAYRAGNRAVSMIRATNISNIGEHSNPALNDGCEDRSCEAVSATPCLEWMGED